HKLSKHIHVDSAGTESLHVGERADIRSRKHAEKRGYSLHSRSRQFLMDDFDEFDFIIAMDNSNYYTILSMMTDRKYEEKVHRFIDFCTIYEKKYSEVPDPYYEGEQGFEIVLDIVEDGCTNLVTFFQNKL
ncbi:MAG: low molecular weight phosphotyrosine protein phosphatase, partial [Bdellovibrionales bacterium]|nr:low molecular weight phosphotyrosine protein phosphatase [Bdellovibrionales bacterium]